MTSFMYLTLCREINTRKKKEMRIFMFDLDSFDWKKLGVINENIELILKNKGTSASLNLMDKLIFSYSDNPSFFSR